VSPRIDIVGDLNLVFSAADVSELEERLNQQELPRVTETVLSNEVRKGNQLIPRAEEKHLTGIIVEMYLQLHKNVKDKLSSETNAELIISGLCK
jgi:hypothetical protein